MPPELAHATLLAVVGLAVVLIAAVAMRSVMQAGKHEARIAGAEGTAAAALALAQRASDRADEASAYASKRADAVVGQATAAARQRKHRAKDPDEDMADPPGELALPGPQSQEQKLALEMQEWQRNHDRGVARG